MNCVFVRNVSDHQSGPPVSFDKLDLNIERVSISWYFLSGPLKVSRYCVVVWEIVSAGITFLPATIKRTP